MTARLAPLDGLRGIAILFVVAGHIAANYQPLDASLRVWLVAFANAEAGVRLFFVLSGYLITSLLLREQRDTGTISLRAFYRRRAFRIFPAFYAYLLAIAVLSLFTAAGITPSTFAAAATFTWNYGHLWMTTAPEGWWNLGHLWTLALEQQFYLLWPALLLLVGPSRSLRFAVLLALWCPFARVATYFLFPAQRGYLGAMFHTGIDAVMIGCAAALLLQHANSIAFVRHHAVLGLTCSIGWLGLFSPVLGELLHGFPAVTGYTLDAVAAAWLVATATHAEVPFYTATLGRGPLPALGLISYSLYLWQQPFLSPDGWLHAGKILPALGCAIAAALASYLMIERPLLHWHRRRSFSAPATPPTI